MDSGKRKITYIVFAICALICLAAAAFSIADRRSMARASSEALEQEVVSPRNSSEGDAEEAASEEAASEEAASEEEASSPEGETNDSAAEASTKETKKTDKKKKTDKDKKKKTGADTAYNWDGADADLTVDFDKLLSKNGDTIGWIEVPAVGASYPLLYYPDNNDYYVNRSFEGYNSAAGVIYLECTNNPDLTDLNSLIYGHNMGDGSMFGRLHQLESNANLYNENPYFYIYKTDGTVNRYKIFSYYQTQKGSLTYSTIESEDGYIYYSNMARDLSARAIDVSFEGDPPIVMLSTCHGGAGTTKRFVVHGVLDGVFEQEATGTESGTASESASEGTSH